MLLSAHLATMNKESVDRRLFGHMVEGRKAGTARRGTVEKRRRGAMGADRQQEAAATAAMEGPGTFNLERLLAYFRIVTKHAYDEDDAASEELARELLSADVFMQISSMVALGLLTRTSGSDALDGVRFRCDIGNDMQENRRQLARQPRQLPLLHVAREGEGEKGRGRESARTSVRGETSSARVARGSRRF